MNPVLSAGAETARLGVLLGWTTALFLLAMCGWIWWAYAPSRRRIMDEASRLPLEDTNDVPPREER